MDTDHALPLLAALLGGLFILIVVCGMNARASGGSYPSICAYILYTLTLFVGVALLVAVLRPALG